MQHYECCLYLAALPSAKTNHEITTELIKRDTGCIHKSNKLAYNLHGVKSCS